MTLDEFFHGNMGRMLLIRVMLRLKRPDLATMDRSQQLDKGLINDLKKAIREVSLG